MLVKTETMAAAALDRSLFFAAPLDSQEKIALIILSFIAFWIIYLIIPTSPFYAPGEKHSEKRSVIIRNYLISTIHALFAVFSVCIWWCYYDSEFTLPRAFLGGEFNNGKGDEYMYYVTCISLGYFYYDTTCMIVYPPIASIGAFIHHALIVTALTLSNFSGVCLPFHFFLLFEELSTPSLNLKYLLKHFPSLNTFFSLSFALLFFISRLLFGSWLFYNGFSLFPEFIQYCKEKQLYFEMYLGISQMTVGIGTRLLNVYWFTLILRKLIQAITGSTKGRGEDNDKNTKKKTILTTTTTNQLSSSSSSAKVVPLNQDEYADTPLPEGINKRKVRLQ